MHIQGNKAHKCIQKCSLLRINIETFLNKNLVYAQFIFMLQFIILELIDLLFISFDFTAFVLLEFTLELFSDRICCVMRILE